MSGPDRERVKEVFLAACRRPTAERAAHVAEACAGDDALRREVESLLAHHEEATLLPPRPPPRPWLGAALSLALALAGVVVISAAHRHTDRSLRREAGGALEVAVDAASVAFEERLRDEAARLHDAISSPEVGRALDRFRSDGDPVALAAALAARLPGDELGLALLDEHGEILVATPPDEEEPRDRKLNVLGRDVFQRMQRSAAPAVALSFLEGALVEGGASTDRPVIALAAPLGGVWCVVALDPRGRVSGAFPAEVGGRSGATYAVDGTGRALTPLLGDAVPQFAPVRRADGRPPRAVAAVCHGEDGVDTDGYVDARGVPVFGAWRWLGDWEIGVVTEVDRDATLEPLRPLSYLRIALLVAAAAAGALLARRSRRVGTGRPVEGA